MHGEAIVELDESRMEGKSVLELWGSLRFRFHVPIADSQSSTQVKKMVTVIISATGSLGYSNFQLLS